MRRMRRRQGTEDPGTVPNARPLKPDVVAPPPEDVFASFIERSYRHDRAALDVPAITAEEDARWQRSVEELLEREEREDADDDARERDRDTDPPPPPDDASDEEDDLRTTNAPSRDEQGTVRVVLLTQKKTTIPPPAAPPRRRGDSSSDAMTTVAHAGELRQRLLDSRSEKLDESHAELRPDMVKVRTDPEVEDPEWASVVPAPSEATQRREAKKLVPDLARQKPKPKPPNEASEDGLIPGGELDRHLTEMAVLLRYGHEAQVARELETVRTRYPQDLLLLRRIAEFWAENKRTERALETLFALASGLFERRNVEGMRQALEQALALDPNSERAGRLLSLLDQRPATPDPKRAR
jgi:hypothetical protein